MWCGGQLANFHLLDRGPLLAGAAVILLAAWAAGQLALGAMRVAAWLDRWERPLVATAVGLNLLSLFALAAGLAGALHQRWLFVAVLVLLAAGMFVRGLGCRRTPEGWTDDPRRPAAPGKPEPAPAHHPPPSPGLVPQGADARPGDRRWAWLAKDDDPRWCWLLVALAPWALVVLLGSMLPPWAYDVREYHLQAPKEWFQAGRIDFVPHNIYANMPLGSELLSLWGMILVPPSGGPARYLTAPPPADAWWWGAMTGKTVMGCYSLLATAAVILLGRRVHSPAAGVLAGLLFLTTPWIATLAVAGYNEGPVAMYAALTWLVLFRASEELARPVRGRLHLLAGVLAGSAVACKYPPALFLVVPAMGWVLVQAWLHAAGLRAPARGWAAATALVLFLAGALAGCGLWLGKNGVLSGNPVYPLLYRVFDGRTRTPEKDQQWRRVHSPQPDASGRRYTLRSAAGEVLWNGWQTAWASLTIPPLMCFAWQRPRGRPALLALAGWMLFVGASWWLVTHRLDRFLVLLLPAAALWAALGALAREEAVWRGIAVGWVLWGVAVQFVYVTIHPDNRYFAPLEALRRDDRGLGEIGVRVSAAHRWLNEHARPGERVLLLGDAEPFDLEIPAVYNTCFDDCQFTRLLKDRTRAQRLAALQDAGIAYVYCSWYHLRRYRSPGNYGYTSDWPTRERVHQELVAEQRLLIPIPIETDPAEAELFRVAAE